MKNSDQPQAAVPPDVQGARVRVVQQLLTQCQGLAPLRTAVVHPVDVTSLTGAVEAAAAKLIVPVLIGPEAKIRDTAAQAGIDISGFDLVSTEHSHAAAAKAPTSLAIVLSRR